MKLHSAKETNLKKRQNGKFLLHLHPLFCKMKDGVYAAFFYAIMQKPVPPYSQVTRKLLCKVSF